MRCPNCHSEDSCVINSRHVEEGDVIRRRRKCEACRNRWTTREKSDPRTPLIITEVGVIDTFSLARVEATLTKCCAKLPVTSFQRDAALEKIRYWATSTAGDIYMSDLLEKITAELDNLHPVARLRFELEHGRPQDAADCLLIVAKAMARQYAGNQENDQ